MHLGGHVSIAGGFDKCVDRAVNIGANCLMTFASSPRSLQVKAYPEEQLNAYRHKKSAANLGPHFFHGVYLINLGTSKPDYLQVSLDSLHFYQQFAGNIGGAGTIFHIGSHEGRGFASVSDQVVTAIDQVLAKSPADVKLFLENCAGQKGTIGTLEELATIISNLKDPSRIGVCLDTQHSFAAGIHLSELLDRFDSIIGLKYLSVIHLNDSKSEFNSRLDRHENLTAGKIGHKELKSFLNDPRIKNIPLILEVPGSGDGPGKADIDTAKSLIDN